jgi:hypothetical protein
VSAVHGDQRLSAGAAGSAEGRSHVEVLTVGGADPPAATPGRGGERHSCSEGPEADQLVGGQGRKVLVAQVFVRAEDGGKRLLLCWVVVVFSFVVAERRSPGLSLGRWCGAAIGSWLVGACLPWCPCGRGWRLVGAEISRVHHATEDL